MNGLSVLKLLHISNGDLLFRSLLYSTNKVRKPRKTKLGQGVEVRAHYPIHFEPGFDRREVCQTDIGSTSREVQ